MGSEMCIRDRYFRGAAAKRLAAVEVDSSQSHQHEFNGTKELRKLLGECGDPVRIPARFIYLSEQADDSASDIGELTWYDARQRARVERGVNRHECRLYFKETPVTKRAVPGDTLILARQQNGSVLAIFAASESTAERQLRWLFGFSEDPELSFSVRPEEDQDQVELDLAARYILGEIGIEAHDESPVDLSAILGRFGSTFPTTREFSEFARQSTAGVSPSDDPDGALVAWMNMEELLFRSLERHLVEDRLNVGFVRDVDGFISYSLSVQNRRKSRVGSALEHHVEALMRSRGLDYSRGEVTENRSKPDFLFPGIREYRDAQYPPERLTMLGVKSSCKDRWRQVLSEARRIPAKHLLTLEPGISEAQTNEMRSSELRLVIPAALHSTYSDGQRAWLMTVGNFISLVASRQSG